LILLQTVRTHEEELLQVKEMLKNKGGPGANGASTSRKQMNQAGIAEEAVEKSCDVLSINPSRDKRRFSNAWLLESGCTYHMCPKRSGSTHMSL